MILLIFLQRLLTHCMDLIHLNDLFLYILLKFPNFQLKKVVSCPEMGYDRRTCAAALAQAGGAPQVTFASFYFGAQKPNKVLGGNSASANSWADALAADD